MAASKIQSLAQRYLGRRLERGDGSAASTIERAEQRLGHALPRSIREYYALCGRNRRLNHSHNHVRALGKIGIEGAYLVFMDENQHVVSWGIPDSDLGKADPVIWQRNNSPPVAWYSEEKPWAELLESMYAWYVEAGIWTR